MFSVRKHIFQNGVKRLHECRCSQFVKVASACARRTGRMRLTRKVKIFIGREKYG